VPAHFPASFVATHKITVQAPDPTIHAIACNDERRMALLTPMHPVRRITENADLKDEALIADH
jgi:hypothetical protein